MPCFWRLVEMVVSRAAEGTRPVDLNYGLTLSQRLEICNDPTNFRKMTNYNFQTLHRGSGMVPLLLAP